MNSVSQLDNKRRVQKLANTLKFQDPISSPGSISRNEKFVQNHPFAVLGYIHGLPAHTPGQGGTQQPADYWCRTFQTLIETLMTMMMTYPPGILSQAIPSSLDVMLPPGHNYTTYLAASYVKWVEGAGARAVPIIVSDNEDNLDYYDQVDRETLGSVNIFSPQDVRWY